MSSAAISFRYRIAGNVRHNPLAAIGVVLIVVFVIFALFAPWIAPQDPASINLPANGHTSFILTDQFPAATNIRGSVESGTGGGQIGALGIRATAAGAYTSIPAMVQ